MEPLKPEKNPDEVVGIRPLYMGGDVDRIREMTARYISLRIASDTFRES